MLVTIRLKEPQFQTTKINLNCKGKRFQLLIPRNNIFEICQQIVIRDEYQELAKVVSQSREQRRISISKALNLIQNAKKYCSRILQIDLFQLSLDLFSNQKQLKNNYLHELDLLSFNDLMITLRNGYDLLMIKLKWKINKKLNQYLSITKRSQSQKNILLQMLKFSKMQQSLQNKNEQLHQKLIQKNKNKQIHDEKKQLNIKVLSGAESDDQKSFQEEKIKKQVNKTQNIHKKKKKNSKETNKDDRIMLGINGDTESGWRQRLRPLRVVKQTLVKNESGSFLQVKSRNLNEVKKVFSYPTDGNEYMFEKDKRYMVHINSCLWIFINPPDQIIIKQDDRGFIRNSEINALANNKGFSGQGIVINMQGQCHLQDGGSSYGGSTIQNVSPNGSSIFTLTKMDVFTN